MSSIVTAVLKATIGLLVDKGRDKAAERLREGDVTERKFRNLIVREIDDIKSKLDGLSRKDLLASISFFEEGIELLYEVFDKARCRSEGAEVPEQAACPEVFALTEQMQNVELTSLDESATRALANAKERFKEARREATRAFKNEALTTSDRILAMEYRVMATILETVDYPADAVAPCRVCIKELNCLSAVQNSFNVELRKGIMARFSKDERGKIISSVCHVNRVIFDVTQAVGKEEPFWMWPTVDTEEGNIDPLRDGRVVEVLRKQGMEHCFVAPWLFGQGGVHKLKTPYGMVINSKGQFIITETATNKVKVFDRRGQFMEHISVPVHILDRGRLHVFDVAVDMNDNIYVLVEQDKHKEFGREYVVYTFNFTGEVHHKFPVKSTNEDCYSYPAMIVDTKRKVVITGRSRKGGCVVDMYENDGQFVRSFGEGQLTCAVDLALASDDSVIVLDAPDFYVHMFSEHGDHLSKFKLSFDSLSKCAIAFHHSSEHVVVAEARVGYCCLHIYKDGKQVRSTQVHLQSVVILQRGLIVTEEGHVALLNRESDFAPCAVSIVC